MPMVGPYLLWACKFSYTLANYQTCHYGRPHIRLPICAVRLAECHPLASNLHLPSSALSLVSSVPIVATVAMATLGLGV